MSNKCWREVFVAIVRLTDGHTKKQRFRNRGNALVYIDNVLAQTAPSRVKAAFVSKRLAKGWA